MLGCDRRMRLGPGSDQPIARILIRRMCPKNKSVQVVQEGEALHDLGLRSLLDLARQEHFVNDRGKPATPAETMKRAGIRW